MGFLGSAITGIAGGLLSGFLGSSAAQQAAEEQEKALQQGEQFVQNNQQNALNFQNGIWSGTQGYMQPFVTGGQQSLGTLETLLGLNGNPNAPGFGTLSQGFQAPTAEQAAAMPGYQFQQQQTQQALQNSAAAKGNLISGNTAEAEANYANQLAGTNYQQAYGNAFNTFEANQNNTFNRLMALSNLGNQSAGTLGQLGQSAANTTANVDLTAGGQLANLASNIGNAQASGTIGSANAWGGALGGATNNLSTLMMLQGMGGGGGNPTAGIDLNSMPNIPLTNSSYYGIPSVPGQ